MELTGKRVLLTGGTAGIGEQMAHQLKVKGAEVIVTGRSLKRLEAKRKAGFEAIEADLHTPLGAERILQALGDRELDVLVNNAGQGVDHDFREKVPDADAADDCIYANLNTPIRLITALVPRLKQRPEAAIVNVTSGLAIAPRAGGPTLGQRGRRGCARCRRCTRQRSRSSTRARARLETVAAPSGRRSTPIRPPPTEPRRCTEPLT